MEANASPLGYTENDYIRWLYNCRDISYTYEVVDNLVDVMGLQDQKLQDLYFRRQTRTSKHLLQVMNRGVRVDKKQKDELYLFFSSLMDDIKKSINDILGMEFNLNSTPQKKKLFKDFFGMKLKIKKGKGTETCDSAAMLQYVEEYPIYKPFFMLLLEYNAIKVITTTFLGMQLDDDGRARTSYKIAGTATGRLASSKNPRGKGGNLQNLPEKGKLDLKYALYALEDSVEDGELDTTAYDDLMVEGSIILPNIKKIILPDEGKEIADADYCLTGDHEVLTEKGWIQFVDYVKNPVAVACWSEDGTISYLQPTNIIDQEYKGKMYHYEGKTSLIGTPKHRQPMYTPYGILRTEEFSNLFTNKAGLRYIHSGITTSHNRVGVTYLKLLVATQADGCFVQKGSNYLRFSLKKARKIDRLVAILDELSVSYKKTETIAGYTNIYPDKDNITIKRLYKDLGDEKNFPDYLYSLSYANLDCFISELRYWDGKGEKLDNFSYFSTNKFNIDVVQGLCSLVGKYAALSIEYKDRNPLATKDLYCLYISNKVLSQHRATSKKEVDYEGKIYCVTVPTSYFIVRHNHKVTVTGNSGADAMIVAAESDCKWLLDFFEAGKGKLYAYIASEHLQREITSSSPEYKPYKAVCHGSNYGLGVDKLASMLGISRDYAQQLQDFYFTLCPEVRFWQARIRNDIQTKGYITNAFGRRGWFLNRNDPTLYNKAYAFVPQASIADLVTEAMDNIMDKYIDIEVLLQVHDSLVFQYPIEKAEECRANILKDMVIGIPYKKMLYIPADMKVSRTSYGDTVKIKEVAKTDNHKKLAPMFQ